MDLLPQLGNSNWGPGWVTTLFLLVKVQTWKTEKKDLCVNMGKTKIYMESGINLDVLKKSGKFPCGVCLTGVGSTNTIFCGGCKGWMHKKCSCIKGPTLAH